jgi:hypothetical protein
MRYSWAHFVGLPPDMTSNMLVKSQQRLQKCRLI